MLGIHLSTTVDQRIWETITSHAALGEEETTFCAAIGTAPVSPLTRRRFSRIYCRGRLIIQWNEQLFAGYFSDVSPSGFGFLLPMQLLPLEVVRLRCDQLGWRQLVIRRCRRRAHASYIHGAEFEDGPLAPRAYRDLLEQLRYRPRWHAR